MESFDTKDCEVMESFDRKFEKFPSKDSELEESANDLSESFPESFDRKFEKFPSKDSELDVPPNELSESFDRKFESSESKDSELNKPANELSESFESKDSINTIRVMRKDSKLDGRSRLRSVKQIEAYKRNFRKEDSLELRLRELDVRMRHLQSLVLSVLRDRKTKIT